MPIVAHLHLYTFTFFTFTFTPFMPIMSIVTLLSICMACSAVAPLCISFYAHPAHISPSCIVQHTSPRGPYVSPVVPRLGAAVTMGEHLHEMYMRQQQVHQAERHPSVHLAPATAAATFSLFEFDPTPTATEHSSPAFSPLLPLMFGASAPGIHPPPPSMMMMGHPGMYAAPAGPNLYPGVYPVAAPAPHARRVYDMHARGAPVHCLPAHQASWGLQPPQFSFFSNGAAY